MTHFQHYLAALSSIFLASLTLGLFVLLNNPRRPTNRIFALYNFSLTWWTLWEFLSQLSPDVATAVTCLRIEYLGVCFIPSLFHHGVSSLTGLRTTPWTRLSYLVSAVFVILITALRHKGFLPDAHPIAYLPYWGKAGNLYFLFILFFSALVFHAHYLLWRCLRREPQVLKRKQLRYFLGGSVIAYVAAIPEFSLKFGLYIPILHPYGLYAVTIYTMLVAYTIIQFKLFDIEVVIRKSLVYSILVSLLTVSYFGLVYGLEYAFKTSLGYQSIWVSLGAFAIMSLLFQPLKIWIQRWVDWLIFRAPQEVLVRRMERLEEQALQAEKFKAVSTLAAGMAHEIKNPLATLKTFTEFLPEKQHDASFLEKLHEVYATELNRIQNMVKDLLEFSKPRPPELRAVDVGPLIASTVNLLSGDLLKQRVQWSVDCQHNGSTINADPDQLRQVLINLIQNASDAMPRGGELKIATRVANSYLELTISDTGHGIPKQLLPQIFDPFVSTKPNGNGLGLAMVYSILQAHRGTIRADSHLGRGTTFTVALPL